MSEVISPKDLLSKNREVLKDHLIQFINGILLDRDLQILEERDKFFKINVGNCTTFFNKKNMLFDQTIVDEVLLLFEEKGWEIERRYINSFESRWFIFRKNMK